MSAPTTERQWVLEFAAPAQMLSANGYKHWRAVSGAKRVFRTVTAGRAAFAELPRGLDRVRIDIMLLFTSNRRRDASNYHPYVAKPIVDGLAGERRYRMNGRTVAEHGYGLIPNDLPDEHLHCGDCPHLRVSSGGAGPHGTVQIVITECAGEEVDATEATVQD